MLGRFNSGGALIAPIVRSPLVETDALENVVGQSTARQ